MTATIPSLLAPFPTEQPGGGMTAPAPLIERGFFLRWLRSDDLPWMRDLYATTRADEMAQVPWPAPVKRAFLDQQFAAQHQHFVMQYRDAAFLAIDHANHGPVGRYYLSRSAPSHLIVDIALFPQWRGLGIGGALIATSQCDAQARGCGMTLHVLRTNPAAKRLYQRLGFTVTGHSGDFHERMDWSPDNAIS